MAIAKSGSSVTVSNLSAGFTQAFTVAAGTDRILVVRVVFWANTGGTITSLTYGGVALTRLGGKQINGGDDQVDFWYLLNPTAGSANVVVTLSAPGESCGVIDQWDGVHQTTPWGTSANGSNGSPEGSASIVVPCVTGEIALGAVGGWTGSTFTMTAGDTLDGEEENGSDQINASRGTGDPSVTLDWTFGTNAVWWAFGAALKPASGGGGGAAASQNLMMMGMS